MVKRLVSLGAAVCILFSFLCIPASASLLSGTAVLTAAMVRGTTPTYTNWSLSTDYNVDYSTNTLTKVGGYEHNTTTAYYRGMGQVSVPLSDVQGTVTVACSYFLYGSLTYNTFYSQGDLTPVTSWYDSSKNTQTGDGSSLTFTVTGDPFNTGNYSTGVSISGVFEGSELNPISDLVISWSPSFCYGLIKKSGTQNVAITSFRVITTDASAATAAQLEEIARSVSQQNNILSAMYGDILAVCNSIYERTGSILEAQNLTNQYFAAVIPLINSINTNLGNIYSVLNTYFDLVLNAINNQTVTLDQSIKDAEKALETYLKPMIDYFNELEETTGESASTLPGHKSDLDGFASDSNGIDADAVTGLASLLSVFSAFSFVFSVLGIFVGLGIFLLIVRKGLS